MIDLSRLGRNGFAPDDEPKEQRETGKPNKPRFEIMIVNNNPMLEALCRNQHTLLTAVMLTRDTDMAMSDAIMLALNTVAGKLLALEESMVAIKKALGIEEVSNGRPGEEATGASPAGEVHP